MARVEDVTGAPCALVVEDSLDVAIVLEAVLAREGFMTASAGTGHSALDAARRLRPELVTLDLGLPDINGLEVCRALRVFTDAYILVISGSTDEQTRLDSLEAGADAFLAKPVNPRELAAVVRALRRRPRIRSAPVGELELAARVQRSLLPERRPVLDGYDLAGACRPCRAVGGDFFDWGRDAGTVAVTLADAMGKGMGAALVAATARAVFRAGPPGRGAGAAVARAAAALERDLDRVSSFVTLLHAELDAASGSVDYVDAGHGLGLLVDPEGRWERLAGGSPPLGLVPGAVWNAETVGLEPGASMVMLSDGVLDSFDGLEDALEAVAAAVHGASGAEEAVAAVLDLARVAEDDVTAVVLGRCA